MPGPVGKVPFKKPKSAFAVVTLPLFTEGAVPLTQSAVKGKGGSMMLPEKFGSTRMVSVLLVSLQVEVEDVTNLRY